MDLNTLAKQLQVNLVNEHLVELGIHTTDTTILIVLISVFIVLISSLCLRKRGGNYARGNQILILGLVGSGKTVLYSQLISNKAVTTHTSMKPNKSDYKTRKGKTHQLIDYPGHPRLRGKVEELTPKSRAIVFLIDSIEFSSQIRQVAEYLYDLFTEKSVNQLNIPIFIFGNKTEVITSTPIKNIQKSLENELEELKKSRMSLGTQVDNEDQIYLGIEGKRFLWDQLNLEVEWGEGSVLNHEISPITDYIDNLK